MRLFITLWLLLTVAAPALAQNPCTTPPTNAVLTGSVNHFFAELPEHTTTEPDGTPRVVAYQYAVWPAAADVNTAPPAQGPTTLPKAAFVLIAGAPNCYELTGGLPGLIPVQAQMKAGVRVQAQPGAPEPFSAWSASNSFSLASTRVTPAAPGQVRIRP